MLGQIVIWKDRDGREWPAVVINELSASALWLMVLKGTHAENVSCSHQGDDALQWQWPGLGGQVAVKVIEAADPQNDEEHGKPEGGL